MDEKTNSELEKDIKQHEDLKSVKLSYDSDKKGWITFSKIGKKKIKLRKHIANIARTMSRYNNKNYSSNREGLLVVYNNYGLLGLHEALLITLQKAREKAQLEAAQQLEALKRKGYKDTEQTAKEILEKEDKALKLSDKQSKSLNKKQNEK